MAPEAARNTFAITWFDGGRIRCVEPRVPAQGRANNAASTFREHAASARAVQGGRSSSVRDQGGSTSAMRLRLRSRVLMAALMLAVVAPHTPVESVPVAAA